MWLTFGIKTPERLAMDCIPIHYSTATAHSHKGNLPVVCAPLSLAARRFRRNSFASLFILKAVIRVVPVQFHRSTRTTLSGQVQRATPPEGMVIYLQQIHLIVANLIWRTPTTKAENSHGVLSWTDHSFRRQLCSRWLVAVPGTSPEYRPISGAVLDHRHLLRR